MGLLKIDTGNATEALPCLQTALQADTSITQFWLSYANALIALERLDEASRILSLAKENGIDSEELLKLDQQLSKHQNEVETSAPDVETLQAPKSNILDKMKLEKALNLAKKKIKEGSTVDAQIIYQDILEKFPKNKKAQKGLYELKKIQRSHTTPLPPKDAVNRLINLFQQGKLSSAVEEAEALTQQYPDAFIVWNILGAALTQLGQTDQAIIAFQKVVTIKPDYADVYNNMGLALNKKGELDAAITAYEKAISLKPNYAEAYNNMGVSLREKYLLDDALAVYHRALQIEPDNSKTHNNIGNILNEQGKLDEAIEAYQNALRLKPDYADAYLNLTETVKVTVPKSNVSGSVLDAYRTVKEINDQLLKSNSRKDIVYDVQRALDLLDRQAFQFRTPFSQIYKRSAVNLNCERHQRIFTAKKIIPEFLFWMF